MRPTVFLLYGHPGTGKLTVAKALVAQIEAKGGTARLVDNHWVANPIFGLVEQDGLTPLPPAVWERVGEVADAVFRTLGDVTPHAWHLVFTAVLDGVHDAGYDTRVRELATARGSVFVPVHLLCDPEETARRIVSPERRGRMKSSDPAEPFRLAALDARYEVVHPNAIALDITSRSPVEAAAFVHDHAERVADREPT